MIVTYHPHLNGLNNIKWKNLKHLQADQLVKLVFIPAPFVSFRTVSNFQSHLVRSNLYPLQLITGYYKCNTQRCQVGKNANECCTFCSYLIKVTFKINNYFDYN